MYTVGILPVQAATPHKIRGSGLELYEMDTCKRYTLHVCTCNGVNCSFIFMTNNDGITPIR